MPREDNMSANPKFLPLSILAVLLVTLFVAPPPVLPYGMAAASFSPGLFPSPPALESAAERSLAVSVAGKSRVSEILDTTLFTIDEHGIKIRQLLISLVVLFLGLLLLKQGIRLFRKRVLPKTTLKPNEAAALTKIIYYFGVLIILLFCMRLVHLPVTAFAFLGGALAVGVGFGAQNLLNNFISGFILMAERPIRLGDLIEIEGSFARVEDIGPRCTRIRTADNIHILVPNSSFLEKNIVNWTLSDQKVRAHVTVGVAYGSPVRDVERLLVKAATENEKVLREPEPFVLFRDFGDNALLFSLYVWVSMETMAERLRLESNIRFRVDDLFREAGIVIAFPQRDIHLDTSRPLELKVVDPGKFLKKDEKG